MLPEVQNHPEVEVLGEPMEFEFDEDGMLVTGF
jgi:hypothetical protein